MYEPEKMKNYWTDRDVADMVEKTQVFIAKKLLESYEACENTKFDKFKKVLFMNIEIQSNFNLEKGVAEYGEPSFALELWVNDKQLKIDIYFSGGELIYRTYTYEENYKTNYLKPQGGDKEVPSCFVEFIKDFDKRINGKTYPDFSEPDLLD